MPSARKRRLPTLTCCYGRIVARTTLARGARPPLAASTRFASCFSNRGSSSLAIHANAASNPSFSYTCPILASTAVGSPKAERKWFDVSRLDFAASSPPSSRRMYSLAKRVSTASPTQAFSCLPRDCSPFDISSILSLWPTRPTGPPLAALVPPVLGSPRSMPAAPAPAVNVLVASLCFPWLLGSAPPLAGETSRRLPRCVAAS